MKRYDCLDILKNFLKDEDLVVTSVGGVANEWYNLRAAGSLINMCLGIPTAMCFGLALALPHRRVVCLETDGSLFLNLGVLCTLGSYRPKNLIVYVLDNECYESIGCFPTASAVNADIEKLAVGAGIAKAVTVRTPEEFKTATEQVFSENELNLIVCKIEPGAVKLPSHKRKPTDEFEDKYNFIRYIEKLENIAIKLPNVKD
jgi:thiamine pyrophosphate-dependent acetolactate synthase large subunit-like protein